MVPVTEMYRVINFVLEMKTLGLRMVPIFKDGIWKLEHMVHCLWIHNLFLWFPSGMEK